MTPSARAALFAGAALLAAAAVAAVAIGTASRPGPGSVTIGGPFALLDGQGRTVTERDFRGRWMLVYFGYTHCPDICPTTLANIADAIGRLPPAQRQAIAPIFITVDPARDTPATVTTYAHAFSPAIAGLSGSADAIAAVERAYHVYAARHDEPGGGYAMDHSSVLYLMRPDGQFAGVIAADQPGAAMARDLSARLAG
jgi:protein SCO1